MHVLRAAALCALVAACGSSTVPPKPDAPASPWSLGPTLPKPRLEPGVTALGQSLVVLGGFDTDQQAGLDITTEVDQFDVATQTWSQLPDAPVAWTHIQLAAIAGTLYLLGGLSGANYVAQGEAFALDTLEPSAQWRPLASMPAGTERGSAAVVVAPPRIYLLGGASTTDALATNLYYDIDSNTWGQDTPDLPAPRSHPAGMRKPDGTLIVAGGLSGLFASMQAAEVFSLIPTATDWLAGTAEPVARGGCAYGVLQGQLVCAGGEADTSALTYTFSYDPIVDVWTQLTSMPQPRAGTQGAAIGQTLYVPGGAAALVFEPTDTLFEFAVLDTASNQ